MRSVEIFPSSMKSLEPRSGNNRTNKYKTQIEGMETRGKGEDSLYSADITKVIIIGKTLVK